MYKKKNLHTTHPEPPKNEETKKKISSWMCLTILLKFSMWGAEGWGHLQYEKWFQFNNWAQNYVCMNIAFIVLQQYLYCTHGVEHWLTWLHDTLPIVLILRLAIANPFFHSDKK